MRRKTKETPSPNGAPALPAPSRLLALVIVAAALFAYHNSFSGVFLFDDPKTIIHNQAIREIGDVWNVIASSRRPVVNLSLATNYTLHELNVWGYHVVNLVIHILSALVLLGIVHRTLNSVPLRERYGQASRWLASVVALIWVVHPLQTQSVTHSTPHSTAHQTHTITSYDVVQ